MYPDNINNSSKIKRISRKPKPNNIVGISESGHRVWGVGHVDNFFDTPPKEISKEALEAVKKVLK